MEELVGRAVKKAFPGFGVYSGVVESYDAEAGYFGVLYKDDDSEEVDLGEMPAILVGPPMRPKKRRRGDEEFPQENGVVVVVEAAAGDGLWNGDVPTMPAERSREEANGEVMAETMEKKWRVNPETESARLLHRSARQAKAVALVAEMEAAAEAAEAVSVRRLRLRLLLHRSRPGGNAGEEAPKGLTGTPRPPPPPPPATRPTPTGHSTPHSPPHVRTPTPPLDLDSQAGGGGGGDHEV